MKGYTYGSLDKTRTTAAIVTAACNAFPWCQWDGATSRLSRKCAPTVATH